MEEESDSDDSKDSSLCLVESKGMVHSPPIKVKVKLDDCVVNMEGGYRRRYVSDVPDHFSRAVAREGVCNPLRSASELTQGNRFLLWDAAMSTLITMVSLHSCHYW